MALQCIDLGLPHCIDLALSLSRGAPSARSRIGMVKAGPATMGRPA